MKSWVSKTIKSTDRSFQDEDFQNLGRYCPNCASCMSQSLSVCIHLALVPVSLLRTESLLYSSLTPQSLGHQPVNTWVLSESSHCSRLQGSFLTMCGGFRKQPALCLHTYPSLLGSGRIPRILSFLEQCSWKSEQDYRFQA